MTRKLAVLVGLLVFVVGGFVVSVELRPPSPAVRHFDQSGIAFDYPGAWRLAPPRLVPSTEYQVVAIFLVGDAVLSSTPTSCTPSTSLSADSAYIELGWYSTVGPLGPWPPPDAMELLTIGDQPAALTAITDPGRPRGGGGRFKWSVRQIEGQESFWLMATMGGPDQAQFRGQIEALLKTVRPPVTR